MKKYRRKRKYVSPEATEHKTRRQPKHYRWRIRVKKGKRVFSLCLFVLFIIVSLMVLTPVFNIDKIEVKGNSKVATEDIIQTGRIFTGDNIWLFRKGRAEKLISEIPYIESVEISRSMPSKVKVTVKESKPYGYVQTGKKRFLLVDRRGKVLQQTTKPSKKLKEIKVSKVASSKPGEHFISDGTSAGRSYKLILSHLKKNGYEDGINKIQIKSDDIRFRFNELLVIIGDTTQLDYKFAFLKTFLSERGDDVEGCFDISAPEVGGYYSENYDENAPIIVKPENEEEESEEAEKEEESAQ